MKGIVYKSTGSWYSVKTKQGIEYQCRIKGKLRLDNLKSTNPLAVGDIVEFDLENNDKSNSGIIDQVCDRKNYILRKSVNLSRQTHILAANIDVLFLVITLNNPVTTTNFIDRFLISSNAYSIDTTLLFNKIDSYSKNQILEIEKLINIYTKIGYKCIKISATENLNINKIIPLIKNKTIMFGGHSGTGKTSIINCIEPKLDLKTANISTQHLQGKHTTTYAELFDIDYDARVIDTPGIKGFGIVNFDKNEIGDFFPEFLKNKNNCKFNNCLHINEPDCYIKKMVDLNKIALSRYENYKQIITSDNLKHR
ncbi:MAG: ribosome small subunit-dependent GTPase A [Flavobacteriaceae bacterium]|nr:ribosome small subunit-dependent GTPase A [Flavobacteriaceae bacterium]|tara:strand:- start:2786 stop:3715 length:930 start_codon:yes stop_codon:yes gene_type:complete